MRPSVRSWQPPGSSHPGYTSHGFVLMHCTSVVGCHEVVIGCLGEGEWRSDADDSLCKRLATRGDGISGTSSTCAHTRQRSTRAHAADDASSPKSGSSAGS